MLITCLQFNGKLGISWRLMMSDGAFMFDGDHEWWFDESWCQSENVGEHVFGKFSDDLFTFYRSDLCLWCLLENDDICSCLLMNTGLLRN